MLENILINYFGLKENWNNLYDKEKDNWYSSYDKLLHLIYDLEELGVINNADTIVQELDKIDNIKD